MGLIKFVDDNPIAAGLLALIVGIVVGLSIPETKSESDLLLEIRSRAGDPLNQVT